MDFYQPPDDEQLGLWQPQTPEEIWGSVWHWIWLFQLIDSIDNPKG